MKDKVFIESVTRKSTGDNVPTLLKFENGELATISKETTQFSVMTNKRKRNSTSAMVVASGNVYHGSICDSEADQLTDLYICVRDKNTNKMQIVPIEQARLSNQIYNELDTKRMDNLSNEDSLKKLLKEFGGRRAMKYIAKSENFNTNAELVKDNVDTTVQDTTLAESDDDMLDTSHLEAIQPKFNKDAVTLADVYQVEDIVPAKLLDALEEEADVVYNTKLLEVPTKSEFIRNSIQELQNQPQSPKNILKMKLIIYMDCLLNLITAPVRSMKKYEISGITEKVENDVRARFCDKNSKSMIRTMRCSEKALCHFIVLALLINDKYEVDINVLTQELHINTKKILKFAQTVNALIKGSSQMLTLRLPSKVPALRTPFKANKRK